ncbi:gamma-aminobutyric acid type B receptor subunit 2 isoform X2 [Periplaneta americana]|uniref:gamma-aminobutyric acid type B receptor subunit 2 isoform X2 n=1 Tax=Periplaneta americana TaxID=6978 RepID=UPI0037E9B9C8
MALLGACLLALLCFASCQKPNLAGNKRRDVYIAGFFPYGRHIPESRVGRGVMPSVMLAVDHINENPSVLRNYMLHMYWNDTECNAAVGVKAFFDMMHIGPHKVMLFGAACTQVTDPIAKASRRWHLTQLSYADTHPMFTKQHFPNFFRVVPSENAFNAPRLKLLQEFNWTRVGTIYQNEPRYSLAHNRLVADLDTMGFQVEETQSFANEVASAMNKLKEKDVRIILGNFNESWARRVFCEAHRAGMFGRKYQWIIMGTYTEEWWMNEEGIVPCSLTELASALEGCILTDLLPLSTNGEITVSGITAEEYRLEYDSRRGSEYSRFHGYTYDGIWAVALAIQHVAHRIRHFRKNQTVVDFRYRDPLWEDLFLEALRNTSFEGVTGPVRFYDNERKASILLKQFQNGSEMKIGEFNGVTEQLDLTRGHAIRWHGRAPPKDRTLQIFEHSHVNITIYSLLAATASVGIVMAISFLAINITYRNQRYIKMSSPYLNNLIIIGCMLTYSSVIFLGLDSTLTSVEAFPYICTARAWLLMAGFSLAFGSMFSKTWRVHSIFTDVKLNKKVIKDYQLFMVVGVLLVIDLAIMTTWQVTDPFYRETKQMEPYPHPSSDDILIVPENEYCQSERMTIFVGSIYAYKGLLMIFGAFLAWETRHVSIPALNDSKYVGMSVYNVVIMCVMGAAISFVLSDKQDASFIIISVFIIFCTTGTLCLVFVPKLIELKRNPQGSIDKRMIRATLRPMSKTRRDSVASELEEKLKDAKAFNQKYRKQLLERETELQMLVRRLGDEGRDILESDIGMDRLAVPRHDALLKREAPSGTETTEISSLCSLNSSQDGEYVNLTVETPSQQRKKTSFSTKPPSIAVMGTREPPQPGGLTGAPAASCLRKKSSSSLENQDRLPTASAMRTSLLGREEAEDSEPLIESSTASKLTVSGGESNVHFVPEGPEEEEEDGHVDEEKSLDRPRLPTPPPALAKVVSFGDVTNTPASAPMPAPAPVTVEDTILPPPKQFHPKQQVRPPLSALRRRSSVKSVSSGNSSAAGMQVLGSRRTSVPVMPYSAGHMAATRSHQSAVERLRLQTRGTGEMSVSSDVLNAGGGGKGSPPPYLLNGGGTDLLTSGGNASSPNVAAMVKTSPCDQGPDMTIIQRSVSEKSRERSALSHHHHHHHRPPVQPPPPVGYQPHHIPQLKQQKSVLHAHVQSTPNVASTQRSVARHPATAPHAPAMCSAVSEGELLDLAILPIFQKLLSERHKSRSGYGASIASCPNISIKCDIVEYL